jgi:RND family efflux transporter MFP subunit
MNETCCHFGLRLISLLITALLIAANGCSQESAPSPPAVRPVRTMVVAAGQGTRERTFPGRVDASRRVELAFQVAGLLSQFPVKEGQKVAKGDLIGQLRQDEFQARLESLQGQLDQARASLQALRAGERPEERRRREAEVRSAEARLTNARADLDRAERLITSRAISRADYERYGTSYRVAQEELKSARELLEAGLIGREEDIQAREAEVRGLEARVVEANIQLRDTTLNAPYDGVVAQRFVEEGQNVRAKDPVVRFQDVDEVEIVVDVPETVMAAEISSSDIVEMVAKLSAAPGIQFPAQIREVAQVADPTTQTFVVRAAFQAPEGIRVLPGMTATVKVRYRRASVLGDAIVVPISAILKDPTGEQAVWVIGTDQTVSRRPVKLGAATGGEVEIVDGLRPGDRIAVAGATFLREGMKVRDLEGILGGGPT